MVMFPVVPPLNDETTVSWCSRMASVQTGLALAEWLRLLQISQASVIGLTDECVTRLADLTGLSHADVSRTGLSNVGMRTFEWRGQSFGAQFAVRNNTTYCPACLLADADNGPRIGRVSWMLSPVRTCPEHDISLTRRRNEHYSNRFQDMHVVAPENAVLGAEVAASAKRQITGLQSYVMKRFDGFAQSPWLDGQGIDQAARACEILGACAVFGSHCNLDKLTHDDWDDAAAAGYEIAALGEAAIVGSLQRITEASMKERRVVGGQAALGKLFQWLQFGRGDRDPGPILQLTREFVLDNFAIEQGADLFGTTVEARRRHTLISLSRQTGLHAKTIRKILEDAGQISSDNNADVSLSFPAVEAEALAAKVVSSIAVKHLPDYLNCNRTQAQMLVSAGLIKSNGDGLSVQATSMKQVARSDVDAFLDRFLGAATLTTDAAGLLNVIDASEVVRQPVVDIVKVVLSGALRRVHYQDQALRFRAVLVNPTELIALFESQARQVGMSTHEAGAILGVLPSGVTWLRKNTDETGRPFLKAVEVRNSNSTIRYCFPDAEVERFASSHITLTELARRRGVSSKEMAVRVRAAGIKTIVPRGKVGAFVYREQDVLGI